VTEALRLDDVWAAFDRGRDRVSVLQGASLSVDAGEIVAVVAAAGQGKTTLVRLASGTLRPDRGVVSIGGVEPSRLKDKQLARVLASDVGVATGTGPGLRVTVRQYVEMAAAAPKNGWRRRWRRRERRRMATAVLDELDIAACGPLRWDELSDWQRVLVELAQAVVVRPRLLLLDDIADRFGLRQKQELASLLEDFTREHECGVLMAVTDHGAAARALRVWRLHRCTLRLIADHTDADVGADGDVIPLRRQADDGDVPEARRRGA
jgi:ABC-type cobalamin/Fe3+-siderophores transport system ATPase subunit